MADKAEGLCKVFSSEFILSSGGAMLAESLHPAAKEAFQSNFAIFLKYHAPAAEVHPGPQVNVLTGIARYDRREKIRGCQIGTVWGSGALFMAFCSTNCAL
jgi:hypothetical protein